MNLTCIRCFFRRAAALAALACTISPVATADPPAFRVPVGESRAFRLERPVRRVAVGNPDVADFIVLNSSELYLLGKKAGETNLILWDQKGGFTSTPLQVSRSTIALRSLLNAVLSNEHDIRIISSGPALVLTGSVSDALAADTACRLVKAYLGGTVAGVNPESALTSSTAAPGTAKSAGMFGGSGSATGSPTGSTAAAGMAEVGDNAHTFPTASSPSAGMPGVVNLLKVRDPQQVRLEVHIAEVAKSYIESLGIGWTQGVGSPQGSLMTGFVSNATLNLLLKTDRQPNTTVGNRLQVEAERQAGLIKILAEPTIVTMSGQEGYFLVGGKIYTPSVGSFGSVDYVERAYGVGLRFMPVVLDAGRISLRVAPEVSEPLKQAVAAGSASNLPAFKTSYVSTTVLMNEGENLVIGGLLRDNLTEVIRAVPLLGDIPLLGTLFRRTEMSSETTELMVVIRPTLVKSIASAPALPTDRLVPPSRKELFIDGKLQGSGGK